MKYILIIWVCSFISGTSQCFPPMEFSTMYDSWYECISGTSQCFPPMEFSTMYDSWYECSREAHTQSKKILANMGFKVVNDARLATKYNCMRVRTY